MPYTSVNTLGEWKAKVNEIIYENNNQEIIPELHKALLKNLADILIQLSPSTGVTLLEAGVGLTGGTITSTGTVALDIPWMLLHFAVYGHHHSISEIINLQDILDALAAAIPDNTDDLPEGSFNFYFTAVRVLSTLLDGLDFTDSSEINSDDNIIEAFGKLQSQILLIGTGTGGGSGQIINCGGRTTGVGELINCGNRI